jgi:hypothetical protein
MEGDFVSLQDGLGRRIRRAAGHKRPSEHKREPASARPVDRMQNHKCTKPGEGGDSRGVVR